MIEIHTFIPAVALEVPGCPQAVMKAAVLAAAIEFCNVSWCWRQSLEELRLMAGVDEYDIELDKGTRLVAVLNAADGGKPIAPKKGGCVEDGLQYFYLQDRSTLRFTMPPGGQERVTLVAVLKPSRAAKKLPEFLYEDHGEAIEFGAKARLMAMPDTRWSNAPMVNGYVAMFRAAADNEKAARINDYAVHSTFSVRPHSYYS